MPTPFPPNYRWGAAVGPGAALLSAACLAVAAAGPAHAADCNGATHDCIHRFQGEELSHLPGEFDQAANHSSVFHDKLTKNDLIRDAGVIYSPRGEPCFGVARSAFELNKKGFLGDYWTDRKTHITCPVLCGVQNVSIEAYPGGDSPKSNSRDERLYIYHPGQTIQHLVSARNPHASSPADAFTMAAGGMLQLTDFQNKTYFPNCHELQLKWAMTDSIQEQLTRIRGEVPAHVFVAPFTAKGISMGTLTETFGQHGLLAEDGDFTGHVRQYLAEHAPAGDSYVRVIFPRFALGGGSVHYAEGNTVMTFTSGGGHFELVYVDLKEHGAEIVHINSTGVAGSLDVRSLRDAKAYGDIDDKLLAWIGHLRKGASRDNTPIKAASYKQYGNMGCGITMLRSIRALATQPSLTNHLFVYDGPGSQGLNAKVTAESDYDSNSFFEEYVQRACYAVESTVNHWQ